MEIQRPPIADDRAQELKSALIPICSFAGIEAVYENAPDTGRKSNQGNIHRLEVAGQDYEEVTKRQHVNRRLYGAHLRMISDNPSQQMIFRDYGQFAVEPRTPEQPRRYLYESFNEYTFGGRLLTKQPTPDKLQIFAEPIDKILVSNSPSAIAELYTPLRAIEVEEGLDIIQSTALSLGELALANK